MAGSINEIFLLELFKAGLTSKSFLDILVDHLQFHFLPSKHHKALFQKIVQLYELNGEIPTIGTLSQSFSKDEETLRLLQKIRSIDVSEKKDSLLSIFEKFIVDSMFISLYNKIGTLHNEGEEEKAISLLVSESNKIKDFSIKTQYYGSVFRDFELRNVERLKRQDKLASIKIPFSIHPTDFYTRGGMSKGTSTCIIARSGVGKSTFMRWVGVSAARLGFKVVHFQAEGTEQECYDAYDSAWTGIKLEDMEFGNIPKEKLDKILKAHNDIKAQRGDVFIKASETFDELSLNDCRDIITDINKIHGSIDLAIFDYAELFTTNKKYGTNESSERKRREDIGNKITNLATLFDCATLTATQASDIKYDKWNDPNFFITRSDIAEFKGFIRPFSNVLSLNQTEDEYEAEILRIYHDKFRKYRSGQLVHIAQSLQTSRFYNSQKTIELFWDSKVNKPRFVEQSKSKPKRNENKP